MVKRKIAVLNSALLVRKGDARPSLYTCVSPAPGERTLGGTESDDATVRRIEDSAAMIRVVRPVSGMTDPCGRRQPGAPVDFTKVKRSRDRKRGSGAGAGSGGGSSMRARPRDRRVSLSLRLDHVRHRRLKIYAACTGRSIQEVLTTALDDCLDRDIAADDHGCPCLRKGKASPPASDRGEES